MYEPDPDLIRAARSGDSAAFEVLVRNYQAHIWRFLRHFLGDPQLAEDVTQETFVRVFRRLDSFRFRSKFSTWVFQVARNAGIDALRARRRRERIQLEARRNVPVLTADSSVRVEIEAALESLKPKHREAFVLVEALGLSYREAGKAIGIPEGTVKSRVFHAREQLVTWMSVREDDVGNV